MASRFSRITRLRAILFRIFYSTSFTIVFLLVITFACAGPIDALNQSYRRGRLVDIFSITGAYVLTGLIAIFLYASRIYTNRSLLRDIPKTYMPTDKGEVGNRRVWRLIEDCKSRSAVIAYLARPRSRRVESEVSYARDRINVLLKPEHKKEYRIFEPQWGTISHPGWSGPASKETPNLEYASVVAELIDLVEARAVSLAPTEPGYRVANQEEDAVDEGIIEALRRPEEAGMRQYISQLIDLDVLDDNSLVVAFLTLYEQARFAAVPLLEDEFKSLMRMFADVLRTMRTLDVSRVEWPPDLNDYGTDISDSEASYTQKEVARTLGTRASKASITSTNSSNIAGSVRRHHVLPSDDRHLSFASPHSGLPARLAMHSFTSPNQAPMPPRISNDSVRSLSSISAYQDAENSDAAGNEGTSWAHPTSQPPFFRARSSNSALGHGGQGSRTRSRSTNLNAKNEKRKRRSRIRTAISRSSTKSGGSGATSLKSARTSGSVIRLNPQFDGSREQMPFEYIAPVSGADSRPSRDDDSGGSVRRYINT